MNKNNSPKRSVVKNAFQLTQKIGSALHTVLKQGGTVEVKVSQKNDDPWNEPEPEIPDWLKQ